MEMCLFEPNRSNLFIFISNVVFCLLKLDNYVDLEIEKEKRQPKK